MPSVTWNAFLTKFFDDDCKVSLPVIFSIKQNENDSVSTFIERFQNIALIFLGGMDKQALVETVYHNIQTLVLTQMGVFEGITWTQLKKQG